MNENQILKEMKFNMVYTFNFYKAKREDRTFKVIKCEEMIEVFLKVKNIPNVLKAVRGLKTWITDVRKLA